MWLSLGMRGYQEDELFGRHGIELIPQDFVAPHGLSILHALLTADVPAAP